MPESLDLSPTMRKFVLHWGEMGSRWGINRTVAQVHALLYVSERPLHAEEIASTLGVARSNVSTSLRELQGWRIVRIVHVLGDRRDHFESLSDVWEMFQIVLDERKRREIDPTLRLLKECIGEIEAQRKRSSQDERVVGRLRAMLDFFETMTAWYGQLRGLPRTALLGIVKGGGALLRLAKPSGRGSRVGPTN
jgi:DNA-binding transcriptional regulator GbsR (MarR family)